MTDIIAAIDAATSPTCGWCETTLAPDAPSDDFCSQDHQQLWHEHRSQPLTSYREAGDWYSPARWINSDGYLQQVCEEIQRIYPEWEASPESFRDAWSVLSPVRPCEACGTRTFLIEHHSGRRRLCQVGHVHGQDGDKKVQLWFHTPSRCDEAATNQLAFFGDPEASAA